MEWFENEWVRRCFYSVCVILAALIVNAFVRVIIGRVMKKHGGQNRRADTLTKLLRNTIGYVIWFIAFIQILQEGLGVNITTIIAAAGVLGVAVGFGAQTLVKDVISGFFILLENQFSVGERVTVDGFEGIVEELGLRSSRIRNAENSVLIIPNGSISKVINHDRAGG